MPMWDLLLENIERRNVRLSETETAIVKSLFIHRHFRKHQYLLQEGQISTNEYFINRGLTRTYRVDEQGYEHILQFSPEEWWAGDLASFFDGTPSLYNVDCIEPTDVLGITKQDLETLFEEVPKMNVYFRVLYERSIVSYNNRLTSTMTKSASERYYEFVERYPQVEQRVPNHQIASFLGITPQSLSRIRKRSMQKGS